MKLISNNSFNPRFNLAFEEYVLKVLPAADYIILWQNEPTVVVGKHQNTIEEINSKYIDEYNINVVRRITGGGAVYHDLGNVNLSFITKVTNKEQLDFKSFTLPVMNALQKMGVPAELSGRNDITVKGKKISGNAQCIYKDRFLHHGTLLFNSDLDALEKALNVKEDKIQSKGIKSVRSRVANIKDYLGGSMSIGDFKRILYECLLQAMEPEEYKPDEKDFEEIKKLAEIKYGTWEWTYGESPVFNFKNSKRFDGGRLEVFMNIEKGFILNCKIYGDFLSLLGVEEIEHGLRGKKYEKREIQTFLDSFALFDYFGNIGSNDIVDCFFEFS